MASAAKKVIETKKGRVPDVKGTPGALVSLPEGLKLEFGRGGRHSPYDALLDQLAAAPTGQVLKFDDIKAKASVYARSKKKGLRVSFAESSGALYVRFDGHVSDDVKKSRREAILGSLKQAPANPIRLATRLRDAGDATVDAPMVELLLTQLSRDGSVIKREGGEWALNPAKRTQ